MVLSYSTSVRDGCRMRRERRHVTAVTSSLGLAPVAVANDNVPQMTALCLSASFCFLVCVTPSIVLDGPARHVGLIIDGPAQRADGRWTRATR